MDAENPPQSAETPSADESPTNEDTDQYDVIIETGPVEVDLLSEKMEPRFYVLYGFPPGENDQSKNAMLSTPSEIAALAKASAAASAAAAAAPTGPPKKTPESVSYGKNLDGDSDFGDQDDDLNEKRFPTALNDADDEDTGDSEEEEDEAEDLPPTWAQSAMEHMNEYGEADDMWEDVADDEGEEAAEGEMNSDELEEFQQQQELLYAERLRDEAMRMMAIQKKKEVIIERYLKIAKVMIRHRKKNIYLQDYLYHLALRKGVLRDDQHTGVKSDGAETEGKKAATERHIKRMNNTTALRFARFLKKTGHFMEEDEKRKELDYHHHHYARNDPIAKAHAEVQARRKLRRRHNQHLLYPQRAHRPHRRAGHIGGHPGYSGKQGRAIPSTMVLKNRKNDCPNCPLGGQTKAAIRALRHHNQRHDNRLPKFDSDPSLDSGADKKKYFQSTAEMQPMKNTTAAIEAHERHRCRLANKKHSVNIIKLLLRAYSGSAVLRPERYHLVDFVEENVREQISQKKKAARRAEKNKDQQQPKATASYLNHLYTKTMDKIRELRMTMAKLEHKHRLVLIRKVKHWKTWEAKNISGLNEVLCFVTSIASHVPMSTAETIDYRENIEQFEQSLYALHNSMVSQIIKKLRAQGVLHMLQRRLKDSESAETPQSGGLSMGDFQRMRIENRDSHKKLKERYRYLLVGYDKLKKCINNVVKSHLHRQVIYGALRAGRHDMHKLLDLCQLERESLEEKIAQIKDVEKLQRKLFVKIAILQNKRLFNDFLQVNHQVRELKDKERIVSTQLHQLESLLRMKTVKWEDTQYRSRLAMEECTRSHYRNEGGAICKERITQRFDPVVPQTVYNVNMESPAFPKRRKCRRILPERQKVASAALTKKVRELI